MKVTIDNEMLIKTVQEVMNRLEGHEKDIGKIKISQKRNDNKYHLLIDISYENENELEDISLETGKTMEIKI